MATITNINPLISICIANYNGENLLNTCIQSIIAQDFENPVEIIVHDDASTDQSILLIKQNFPQVKLIESHDNVGFCISNNRMVEQAQGQYILLLNNDASLHKDALSTLLNYSENQTIQGILGLPQYNMDTGELIDLGMLLDPFLTPVPNLNPTISGVGLVIGACFWIPKSLWETLGGFPEWFVTLAEDLYLCCLARLQSYPVQIINKSGYDHKSGASLGGGKICNNKMVTSTRRRRLSEQNRAYIIFICYPTLAFLIIFPIHLFSLIIEGIFLSIAKKDSIYWTEIYWNCIKSLYKNRKHLLKTRNQIQQFRNTSLRQFFAPHVWYIYKLKMLFLFGLPKIK